MQDAEYRYEILKIVCDITENFEVSRIEIDSDKQLFTFQTLDLLSKEYSDYDIYLVIGSDNLKSFYTWREYEYILQNYKVIVFFRNNDTLEEIITKNKYLSKYRNNILFSVSNEFSNISSTQIRNNIKEGKEFKHLIPKEAYDYIILNNRYKKE